MKTNDTKRKTLTDILALAKSMKGEAMRQKYAPPEKPEDPAPDAPAMVEGSPAEEAMEAPAMEAKEDATSPAPDAKAILLELQADPARLKALLAKKK